MDKVLCCILAIFMIIHAEKAYEIVRTFFTNKQIYLVLFSNQENISSLTMIGLTVSSVAIGAALPFNTKLRFHSSKTKLKKTKIL